MVKKGENIYKRKDNRWEGRYIKNRKKDGSIHYGYLYSKNYNELKRELIILKAKNYEEFEFNNEREDVLFLYWAEHWISTIKKKLKLSTYTSYRYKMEKYIIPHFGKYELEAITTHQVESWKKNMMSSLSVSSIKVVIQILNKCMSEAVEKKLLKINPCKECRSIKSMHTGNAHLSYENHHKLRNLAYSDKNGLAIALALESGLRIGEIAGLKWKDINFEDSTLSIKRTIQRIYSYDESRENKTHIIEGSPKSSSSYRTIPISPQMLSCLFCSSCKIPSNYVFGSEKPSEPRKISKWLKKICKGNNLEYVHFHELRHSFANRCLEGGVSITTTSELLGHRSVKMTLDMYSHSSMTEKRKAIEILQFDK